MTKTTTSRISLRNDTALAVETHYAYVDTDGEVLAIVGLDGTEDADTMGRKADAWIRDNVDHVVGARVALIEDGIVCVGDYVDVDDDGNATLRRSWTWGSTTLSATTADDAEAEIVENFYGETGTCRCSDGSSFELDDEYWHGDAE